MENVSVLALEFQEVSDEYGESEAPVGAQTQRLTIAC